MDAFFIALVVITAVVVVGVSIILWSRRKEEEVFVIKGQKSGIPYLSPDDSPKPPVQKLRKMDWRDQLHLPRKDATPAAARDDSVRTASSEVSPGTSSSGTGSFLSSDRPSETARGYVQELYHEKRETKDSYRMGMMAEALNVLYDKVNVIYGKVNQMYKSLAPKEYGRR